MTDWIKKKRIVCSIVSFVLLMIVAIFYYANDKATELKLVGGIIYYPAITIGIVFCVALSKMIENAPIKSYTVFITRL